VFCSVSVAKIFLSFESIAVIVVHRLHTCVSFNHSRYEVSLLSARNVGTLVPQIGGKMQNQSCDKGQINVRALPPPCCTYFTNVLGVGKIDQLLRQIDPY
jgi:hypothetical protein